LLPVVSLVLGPVEVVGLVDEEAAAVGATEHLLRLRRRVADVLAHEVVARAGHDARLLDVAEAVQYLRHLDRDRRLAGPRVARERHVQRRPLRREADLAPQLVDQQQRRDLADAGLDGLERDQLAVELVEHLEDVRLVEDLAEVGLVGRRRRRVELLLVDVVLVGLGRLGDQTGRPLHAELEAHASGEPPLRAAPAGEAGASRGTSRKLLTRPRPWIRSSVNGCSTDGRLTMNDSAVVWRVYVGS